VRKLEDGLIGGIAGKGFTQERDIVTELLVQVAQAGTSWSSRNITPKPAPSAWQRANLSLLGGPHSRQGTRKPEIWRVAGSSFPSTCRPFRHFEASRCVVDGNPGTFHDRVPTPHARGTNDVTIGLRDRVHTWMVRLTSQGVNFFDGTRVQSTKNFGLVREAGIYAARVRNCPDWGAILSKGSK
jgi:hypothetical protein